MKNRERNYQKGQIGGQTNATVNYHLSHIYHQLQTRKGTTVNTGGVQS